MEDLLSDFTGRRVTCELSNGTMLMGTIQSVDSGVLHISDSGIDGTEYVSVSHVVRMKPV